MVDDESIDGTREVVEGFVKKIPVYPAWLADAELMFDSLDDVGIAGVAGASLSGGSDFRSHLVGHIKNGDEDWRKKIIKPECAQTVDELLMIVPRAVFSRIQFDEKRFNFIHLYGVDYFIVSCYSETNV